MSGYLLAGFIKLPNDTPPINFHLGVVPTANTSVSGTASVAGCFDDIGPSGTLTQLYSGYVTYACVINTTNSNGAWSGRTSFTGQTFAATPVTVTWNTTSGNWFVCRFPSTSAAYPCVDVKTSLENQNYVLVQGANHASCPTISSVATVQSYP
jgi:hypothetical protein